MKQSVKEARSLEFIEIAGTSYVAALSPALALDRRSRRSLARAGPPKRLGFSNYTPIVSNPRSMPSTTTLPPCDSPTLIAQLAREANQPRN